MSDSPQNTQTPQLIATPIRLRVVQPKEPIPIGIMAALQGPPGKNGDGGCVISDTDFLARYILKRG